MRSLTPDQQATYSILIDFGFSPNQAKHASIRYGSNADGAVNWVVDNPSFDFEQESTPSPPRQAPVPLPSTTTTSAVTIAANPVNDYRPSTPVTTDSNRPFDPPGQDDGFEELPHPNTLGSSGSDSTDPQLREPRTGAVLPPPPGYDDLQFGPESYHYHDQAKEPEVRGKMPDLDSRGTRKGQLSQPSVQKVEPSPVSQPPMLDLTNLEDGTHSTDEATDLQRAIQLSAVSNHNQHLNPNSTSLGFEEGNGDDDISKALALSMASLGSTTQSETEFLDQMEQIKPEERTRESLATPVILRSLSPHMSSLSSYLQSLYAISTWRKTILEWREPKPATLATQDQDREDILVDVPSQSDKAREEEEGFAGVWKGEADTMEESDLVRQGLRTVEEQAGINRIKSIQRLFALMTESRRRFVHVQEVVKAFELRESQFHHGSGIEKIREVHTQLISDLQQTSPASASTDRFTVQGRRILVDQHIGVPLPPVSPQTQVSTQILDLLINPASVKHQTFYERLDDVLLNNVHFSKSNSVENPENSASVSASVAVQEYHLLTTKPPNPKTLVFGLNRQTELLSLDDFGSTANASNANHENATTTTTTKRNLTRLEKEIWLDRYHVSKRKEIKQNRDELLRLEKECERLQQEIKKLGTTKDGKDAVQVVRGIVQYLKGTSEGEPLERKVTGQRKASGVDVEMDQSETGSRKERQERLRHSYTQILKTLESKIENYSTELTSLETKTNSLYSSSEWRNLGPYKLRSYLFRNGLNGRGSSWSVTYSVEEDKWYKIKDLERTVVEDLDKELEDRTGLFLDAGVALAFYELDLQYSDMKLEAGMEGIETVPQHLKLGIIRDNHSFASTLTSTEENLKLIESWGLPPLETLPTPRQRAQPSPPFHTIHQISLDDLDAQEQRVEAIPIDPVVAVGGQGYDRPNNDETVENITLSPPPPEYEDLNREEVVDTPMSVDLQDEEELEPLLPVISTSSDERENQEVAAALRLRGGASVETDTEEDDENDEEYSDEDGEEYDEDEVELGLLKPMPSGEEPEWDVDYAVGKIGGKPVWLDPRSPLDAHDVQCGVCQSTMSLLLQVNSPDDSRPHAAARSLYVFACRSKDCLSKDSEQAMRVWRTQMASPNEFFPHTAETITKRKELESLLDPTSGLPTDGASRSTTKPWPEWDIAAEPEPYEESYLPDPSAPSPEQADGGEDADAPDTISGVDQEFLAFQERIEREPRQVLRFYRLPDIEAPEPLWTSKKKIDPSQVPPCELCRGPREIEFQILSTLLSHLDDDHLDFDSLLVYTCLDNCKIPPRATNDDKSLAVTGWMKETIYKQDFTSSGVRFGFKN